MSTTFSREIKRFRDARMWQDYVLDTPVIDQSDAQFLATLRRYLTDLKYRVGLLNPYKDALHRLAELKQVSRDLGQVYDGIAQYAGDNPTPPAAQQLLDWLNSTTMDLAYSIAAVEESYPELVSHFAAERAHYAATLNA